MAKDEQEQHREDNVKEGMIRDFLEKPVPDNYDSLSLAARRMFWAGTAQCETTVKRTKTCALEIWCECFGGDPRNMKRSDARDINYVLAGLPGWKRNKSRRRYGYCGVQRGFEIINI